METYNIGEDIRGTEIKSRLTLMATHEFRTILASILFSTTLISKYQQSGDEIKLTKHIQRIKNSVHEISIILDDLFLIEQSDTEKIKTLPSNPILAELVKEYIRVKKKS